MKVAWMLLTLTVLGCVKWSVIGHIVADISHLSEEIGGNGSDCSKVDWNGQLVKRLKTALIFSESGHNNQQISGPQPTSWWLDGNDAAQEGKWMWFHNNSPITFTDWYKTEPDNNGEASHCLIYWEIDGWKWGDSDCPVARRYICQTHLKPCGNVSA
ncbi:hypothetical protein CHUAL_005141 [Chamberlinius hualienensis]